MIIIITVKLVEMPYNYTLYYSQKKTKDPLPCPTPLSLVTVYVPLSLPRRFVIIIYVFVMTILSSFDRITSSFVQVTSEG